MGFFSRSKRKETTAITPPQPQLQKQSTHVPFYQQSNHTRLGASADRSKWTATDPRPSTSHGYHPQPQSWLLVPVPQQSGPYLTPSNDHLRPPHPPRPKKSNGAISKLNLSSMTNLLHADVPPCIPGARIINDGLSPLQMQGTQYLNQGAALCDQIATKLNEVITLIDGERFSGHERDLVMHQPAPIWQQQQPEDTSRSLGKGKSKGMVNNSVSTALTTTNYFAKVNLYANSRLPPNLPPLKLYMSTYPLLCLAAQYSERVYTRPAGQERDTHVDADWKMGTKAMVIKSVPMDDMNTIVFAIRGSQTFMDWAVNLNSAPAAPNGFLDDPGNLCHAGFLTVARKMIKPVAARLRHLLQEDPNRSRYSLLITGHSAGGAVAALIYSHMLASSRDAESELNILTGCFKRIHCVTFGSPPVSLLPLTRPTNPALRKSVFLSFVNEGDPVPRADKAYVRSLLDLYSSPAPAQSSLTVATPHKLQPLLTGPSNWKSSSSLTLNKMRPTHKKSKTEPVPGLAPLWRVPEATLSNAGRLVLLRSVQRYDGTSNKKKIHEMMNEGIVAQTISDDLLRGVIWGDPVCHMMKIYARRIEILATNAVMGRT